MDLIRDVVRYVELKLELVGLKLKGEMLEILASGIGALLLSFIVLLITVMASVGLAFWIGETTGALHQGFLIVAGAYMLVAVVILANKVELNRWLLSWLVDVFRDRLRIDELQKELKASEEPDESRRKLAERHHQPVEETDSGHREENREQP